MITEKLLCDVKGGEVFSFQPDTDKYLLIVQNKSTIFTGRIFVYFQSKDNRTCSNHFINKNVFVHYDESKNNSL